MTLHLDGIVSTLTNATTGMGGSADPTQNFTMRMMPGTCIGQDEASEMTRRFGLLRKVVTTIPKAATARWGMPTLPDGKAKDIEAIAQALKKLPVRTLTKRYNGSRKAMQVALSDAFRFGNAGIIMDVDDGRTPDQPIDLGNIRSIRQLFVMDRWTLVPDLFGIAGDRLTHYRVVRTTGLMMQTHATIHSSRVLWLSGVDSDDTARQWNNGCDDSILEGVLRAFTLYQSGVEGAARMVQDFDVMIHKIQGLMNDFGLCADDGLSATAGGTTSAQNAGTKLMQRLALNQKSRSLYKGMVIDKDAEELSSISRSASGYSDLVEMLKANLQSATPYPPAILFGEFSSGLDASGKSTEEKQLWNETIAQEQSEKLDHLMIGNLDGDEPMPGLLQVVCLAKNGPTKGKIPEGLGWRWNDVYPPTPGEQAELEQSRSTVLSAIAALDPRFTPNAILSHYGANEFNPNVTLSPEYKAALEKEIKEATKEEPEAPEGSTQDEAPVEAEATGELTPEEQAELEQLEAQERGDSLRHDSIPINVAGAFRTGLERATGRKAMLLDKPKRIAAKLAKGYRPTEAEEEYLADWLFRNRRYSHARANSPKRIAWELHGGHECDRWLKKRRGYYLDSTDEQLEVVPVDLRAGLLEIYQELSLEN